MKKLAREKRDEKLTDRQTKTTTREKKHPQIVIINTNTLISNTHNNNDE